MRRIIFIFGAGASFGAGDIIPERPPLGSRLYSSLATIHPHTWGDLPAEVKLKFEADNFESGMGTLYERYSQVVPQLIREMAVYLIQFRPSSGHSLYCNLIRYLRDNNLLHQTLFSTLNYDCILEFSLLRQGINITYFDEGTEHAFPVWKLHGSCNMFSRDVKASGILYSKGVVFEGGLEAYMDIGTVVEHCLVNQALAPAMCLYMKGKPLQISPSVILGLQNLWRSQIMEAGKVFCIGINPWPEDDHIWAPLSQTQAQLYFVGDRNSFKAWTSKYRSGPSELLAPYFHTGYELIERRLLVNEAI